MAKIIGFPNKTEAGDKEVLRLMSLLKSNIIELAQLKAKLLKLQADLERANRNRIRLVKNDTDTSDPAK